MFTRGSVRGYRKKRVKAEPKRIAGKRAELLEKRKTKLHS